VLRSDDLTVVLAYHFPPENAIGGQRPFRFCKYLLKSSHRCHVISAADVSRLGGIEGSFVPDPFVVDTRRGIGWHVERLVRRFFLPGIVGLRWSILTFRVALRVIRENTDCRITILSTSPPIVVHLVAYLLKSRTRVAWIADCRDPIAGNPGIENQTSFSNWVYRQFEWRLVHLADITIANTDSAQAILRQRYPEIAERIKLIWNGFDPEERLAPLPLASPDRKILAHIGALYGGRTVVPILKALRRLIRDGKLNKDTIQLLLVGFTNPSCLPDADFVKEASAEGWLRIVENLPKVTAAQIMRSVDALLIVQPQTTLQVPGKLFEYIQLGRPLLAFVPRESPIERILRRSGVPYQCLYNDNTEDQTDSAILEFFCADYPESRPSSWFEQTFNAQIHTERIIEMIEGLHTVKNAAPLGRAASA
jgi:glycosyltransferase involved in cell wall biosynthesis